MNWLFWRKHPEPPQRSPWVDSMLARLEAARIEQNDKRNRRYRTALRVRGREARLAKPAPVAEWRK